MNWKQVSVSTTESDADLVASLLMDAGASGVEIEGGDVPAALNDEHVDILPAGGEAVRVKAYYDEDGFDGTLHSLRQSLLKLGGHLTVDVVTVPDTDWNENFKKHFTAFRAAGCFVVKPTWEQDPSGEGDIVIEIDPGMAFGSGLHETTRMCLELLQKHMRPRTDVLDVGCGSGILSIGAAKLGAQKVLALDNDATSVKVARANAKANGADGVEVRQSDLLSHADKARYDIILANIIADIVIRLNQNVGDYLKQDGVYIISGIIDERLCDVTASLKAQGFEVIETLVMADWRAVAARRRHA